MSESIENPDIQELTAAEAEEIQATIDAIIARNQYSSPHPASPKPNFNSASSFSKSMDSITDEAAVTHYFVQQDPGFFVVGRVFEMNWAQAGGVPSDDDKTVSSLTVAGVDYHVKRRILVVIRQCDRHCRALPIYSYDGKGVSSPYLRKAEHCIIHTRSPAPTAMQSELPLRGYRGMYLSPLRVNMTDRLGTGLHPASRLNLGKIVSPVEYYTPVKDFGMVHPDDISILRSHFAKVMHDMKETERKKVQSEKKARNVPSAAGPPTTMVAGQAGLERSASGIETFAEQLCQVRETAPAS